MVSENNTRSMAETCPLTLICLVTAVSFGLPQSFTLEFHFEPNDFFTNTVLTKTYKMRSEPDESDPFSFDGPEIMCCTGYSASFFCSVLF